MSGRQGSAAPGASPAARVFVWRSHVRAGLRFFILLVCSGMVAAAVLAWEMDPRAGADATLRLLLPVAAALIAGALTWRAADVWTAQYVVLRPDSLEHQVGASRRVVRFDEVTAVTFRHLPYLGGQARIAAGAVAVKLGTNLKDITPLLLSVRRQLAEHGRGEIVCERAFRTFLLTAAFAEQRADRYRHRYGWFPWLAALSPVLVLVVARGLAVPVIGAALWTGVFAVYPWLVVAGVELALLRRFTAAVEAAPEDPASVPPVHPRLERRTVLRGALAGYYGYLLLNVAMLIRLA
ncbi:MAG: hypothetical protein JXQ29_00015 [Planctomycetes bacterium]|nr:hypothetical protein [Planctomycetota bacterium]